MNLYKLHAKPKALAHHDAADTAVPVVIWNKYEKDHDELKKREAAIAKDPGYAYKYAKYVLKGPFKEGEAAIAKDPRYVRWYAKGVLKHDFYLDGKLIAKSDS